LSIDWHDFVVVETIEFTEADEEAELPLPLTRKDVENMTLEQRKLAAMAPIVYRTTEQQDDGMDVEEEEEEEKKEEVKVEKKEEKVEQVVPVPQQRPDMSVQMKIRRDYVPKGKDQVMDWIWVLTCCCCC
jgi:splicing factor 3A subunit 1